MMRSSPIAALAAVALSVAALTGCVQSRCADHAATPVEAVEGLLRDLPAATSPAEICQYVSEGWVVSQDDLVELKDDLSAYAPDDVTLVEGDQMGTGSSVDLMRNGIVEHTFSLSADESTHWTIDLGHIGE